MRMTVPTFVSTCRLRDDRPCDLEITRVMRECVESFYETRTLGPLVVVDDGSTEAHRRAILELSDRFDDMDVVWKPENLGTARSKNTALRAFRESGAEHCFLIDDDIRFLQHGWQDAYVDAMRRTGLSFLSFFEDSTDTMVERGGTVDLVPRRISMNGVPLKVSDLVMGVLFAYGRPVLDQIGGFREFPRRYGHWHTEHNYRCVEAGLSGPTFTDLAESTRFVRLNDQFSVYSDGEKLEMARANAVVPLRQAERFAEIVE